MTGTGHRTHQGHQTRIRTPIRSRRLCLLLSPQTPSGQCGRMPRIRYRLHKWLSHKRSSNSQSGCRVVCLCGGHRGGITQQRLSASGMALSARETAFQHLDSRSGQFNESFDGIRSGPATPERNPVMLPGFMCLPVVTGIEQSPSLFVVGLCLRGGIVGRMFRSVVRASHVPCGIRDRVWGSSRDISVGRQARPFVHIVHCFVFRCSVCGAETESMVAS